MTLIRTFEDSDWPAVWNILAPIFRAGDTYGFAPDIAEEEARRAWIEGPDVTFVAEDEAGVIHGSYYLKPNWPGPGSHVCNCGYVVDPVAQGKGVASSMCQHSQEEGVRRGFRAMQYNFVVSTNEGAIRLWQKLGFEVVGTLPEAFQHPTHGYVDAYVMHKKLVS
ncbi:GNAT family N-acetyltransferase [Salinisphaera sp. USBA-960]|uniref:GNAT family N-acetyltransferase n=1 Tax=Salinisphaera orenii TaxID=856731 RepID=UPI000DBE0A80|nr:GNAT family N-acetyltransferase [Salifodinibacter halophilus]NNC26354.1 GNAT family N-acetyltransferase [Salifodinibacter halophilus]